MALLILTLVAVIAIAVLPVKLAAGFVGAERTGFGSVLVAVVLQFVLVAVVRALMPDGLAEIVAAVIVGSIVYAYALGTSVIKGFIVSVLATVIAVVAILMLGSSFALLAAAT